MDACLSFVMTNHAQVQPGHFVFDPFVGTGKQLYNCKNSNVKVHDLFFHHLPPFIFRKITFILMCYQNK
jgi:hypothetical protein